MTGVGRDLEGHQSVMGGWVAWRCPGDPGVLRDCVVGYPEWLGHYCRGSPVPPAPTEQH